MKKRFRAEILFLEDQTITTDDPDYNANAYRMEMVEDIQQIVAEHGWSLAGIKVTEVPVEDVKSAQG